MRRDCRTLAAVVAAVIVVGVPVAAESARQRPRTPAKSAPAKKPVTPPPASRTEKPVPFRPGERLTYDISYSGTLSAGEATITVRDKRPSYNSTAYYIVAEGKPTGLLANLYTLYYKADTLVDSFTLLPQRGSLFSREGKRARQKTTMFNQRASTGSYEIRTATLVTKNLTLPAASHDGLSALVALRAAQLGAGTRLTVPVSDSGHQYSVHFTVEGREVVETNALTAAAWKIRTTIVDDRGQSPGRAMFIWISDDVRRLPLKMEAELAVGSFVLELRQIG